VSISQIQIFEPSCHTWILTRFSANLPLEGSVRRAGDEVRINAQLIDATTGGHLWAERFDSTLADVFAVQDEITQRIAHELTVIVSADDNERLFRRPATNFEAYELFLRAAHLGAADPPEHRARARVV
jgi:hypothetical protein